jgi:hypothetical protein
MIGLNRELEALWEYRIAQFLCWPGESPLYRSQLSNRSEQRNSTDLAGGLLGEDSIRPFYSFVKTVEGSSLLTSLRVLKQLFPSPEERASLIYSEGELEVGDLDENVDEFGFTTDPPTSKHGGQGNSSNLGSSVTTSFSPEDIGTELYVGRHRGSFGQDDAVDMDASSLGQ